MRKNSTLALNFACVLALLALIILSARSLTTFPTPFDDEGVYAAYGRGYFETGKFNSPSISLSHAQPYHDGNAMYSRVNTAIFGVLGHFFGYSLATARAIPLALIWIATAIWYFISRRLGFPAALGALLFASTERVLYASHVFRPESTLLLANTVFLYWIVRTHRRSVGNTEAFGRGLFNGFFVLAHGNGLVSAILNSLELAGRYLKTLRKSLGVGTNYLAGSLLAIALFYFIQLAPAGGLEAFRAQMRGLGSYDMRTPWQSLLADLHMRWGTELIDVGHSRLAKLLRFTFYGLMATAALRGVVASKARNGLTRKFALLSIGAFLGYVFIVEDKIDIHIAEMIPFYLAAFQAVIGDELSARARTRARGAVIATAAVVAINVALSTHHLLTYDKPTVVDQTITTVESYLASPNAHDHNDLTIIAPTEYWYHFSPNRRFISLTAPRYAEPIPYIKGRVIAIGRAQRLETLKGCKVNYASEAFDARFCP